MKKVVIFTTILGFIIPVASQAAPYADKFNGSENSSQTKSHHATGSKVDLQAVDRRRVGTDKWQYSARTNDETGQKNYYAALKSLNIIPGTFGGSQVVIALRKTPETKDIFFTSSQNVFSCSFTDKGCLANIKIDDKKEFSIPLDTADPSIGIFVKGEKNVEKFAEAMQGAKKLTVELPVSSAGKVPLNFNIDNLKWDYF